MKRFFTFLVTFSLVEAIGRHPAIAGALMLLGVGGGAGIANLLTPTIVPFISSNFNPNQPTGVTLNLLKPNGGTAGAFVPPNSTATSGPTGSFGLYFEAQVNPNLAYGNGGGEAPFAGMFLNANTSPGQPVFTFQRSANGGIPASQWMESTHVVGVNTQSATLGTNYATGMYPFSATGGGCAREPAGVWFGTFIQTVDPGFGCSTAPTFSAATVPNGGAQQTGITATCASGGAGMLVTTSVPVSPGLSPGLTYSLSAFTTSPTNVINTSFTATSVTGAGPYTVVGTAAGTCPTISSTGTFGSGTGAAYTFPAISASAPLNGGTGITAKNGQHLCGWVGEYGDDSPFPGAQFVEMVDDKGNPLPGSPALVQTPNQGTANFTGWTTIGSTVLNVTAMNPYTITAASFNATTGFATFTTSTNPGFVPGSQFTVSGVTSTGPGSFNLTYAAVAGTTTTTIVASPLSGPGGIPAASSLTGSSAWSSGGSLVSIIFPGMQILNSTPTASMVLPYGTGGTTGTGSNGSVGTPASYALSASQTAALGGGASPGSTIFAWSAFYYSAATSGNPAGDAATVRGAGIAGDFTSLIGAANIANPGANHTGWGSELGNFAMLTGVLPSQTGGAPSTTDLASLCTKATDIQAYAKAKSLKVQSLYRLNDLGIWGDSSYATITGFITNPGGSAATLNVVSTTYGSLLPATSQPAKLTGPGLPVASPATISLSPTCSPGTGPLCAGAVYTLSATTTPAIGSAGAPVTFAVGAWAPALPVQSSTFKGYIDTTSGVSTLHVTSLDDGTSHSGFVSFTGTLGTSLTGSIVPGTGSNGAAIGQGLLTVSAPGGSPPANAALGVGTVVSDAVGCSTGCATPTTVVALGTGVGYTGTYVVDVSQTVSSRFLFGSGILPGPATNMQTSGTTIGSFSNVIGMAISDQPGSSNLTAGPLLITGVGGNGLTLAGNYYPPFVGPVQASLTTLVPGEYIQNSAITNPVKVTAYGSGAIGLLGNYTLSGSPNASGSVGSIGSPVVLTGTTITDGGAIAPGPALTIKDQGPAITFPLTNIGANTGTIALSGTYDVPTLGGTPSGIQVLVSNSANGPPLAGCTPCNWGALTGTISGGKWSGTIAGIPGGGPYIVSVRAANGVGYATLPNSVKVGWVFALWGQGQADSMQSGQSGFYTSYFSGLWGFGGWNSAFGGNEKYLQGPPITANFVPGQPINNAGDRFGVGGSGIPISEAVSAFDQKLLNVTGVPATFLSATRDGVGVGLYTLGNAAQTQTIGAGDGSTLTWCSASKFCASAGVSPEGTLVFGAASLTGGWFTGASISGTTFSAGTRLGGALEPGMVLNTPNAPSLVMCLTGCSSQMAFGSSTWLLSNSLDSGAIPTRADPVGGAPWPNLNIQQAGTAVYGFGGFGVPLIKAGTFAVSDNGAVLCQDTNTFAYNQTGGTCIGATVASSFVNYQTGDYQITFTSGHAPLSGHAITASWTNIISPEAFTTSLNRPQGLDFFGDSTGAQSGADAALFAKAPGGVNGHIYSGEGTDHAYMLNSLSPSNIGYQYGGLGYSQMVSWLYGTKFPALIPGASSGVPFLATGQWRIEGPVGFANSNDLQDGSYDQWATDVVTQSIISGQIASNVLTLKADTTFPMWEGEILNCAPVTTNCTNGPFSGVYITSLTSGAWGKNGSTYALAGSPANVSVTSTMQNPVFYSGTGPAYYVGTLNDVIVQSQGLSGTVGRNPHTAAGFTGGRRATSRWAAMIDCHNGGNCDDPKLSRANDSAAGTPSPAFDYSTTYQASHVATWAGNIVTISGGLTANARPFVVGQAVSCASCNSGLVITSLSVPPTQSTATGAGEVGQTFTFVVKNASGQTIGGSGSGTIAAGCSPTGGSGGSNCINVDVALNVSGATAIATCGANNINGNAPNYVVPNGKCQDNGIGEIVRTFRIGTTQASYGAGGIPVPTPGSVWDDGVDMANGAFNQSAAFTCNIVAAKVVQCVKGPVYSGGGVTGIGQWSSGSTYISYGDVDLVSGRIASLLGYVGGQSFPFTGGGTGYSNQLGLAATCTTIQSLGAAPRFDVFTSGGVIVDVVPSAAVTGSLPVGLGIGSTCTLTPATGTGFNGTGSLTIPLAPVEGQGGIATYNTDSNTMGMFLYDNSGEPGNPLNPFFTNGMGGYFEPGLPLRPFGNFQGAAVSG
jgi:hypothetical protein